MGPVFGNRDLRELSANDTKLPMIAYLGFTGVTGEVHELSSTLTKTRNNNTPPPAQKKSGVMWYLKFLGACAVFGVLVMAFKLSKGSNDNKRF
ncbi:hypothetical protein BGZ65_007396 [Modicella reniformis]|uniref:Uncharacterized protein n=1 Tax=Modicella reniformis TaxID=1440133 RepID=A0A9P6MFZ2_9FUNG|nr:hypothetical protein BGZ65_007396 [Modicella reniformis]